MKRLKIRKRTWFLLVVLIVFAVLTYGGIKVYQDYKYKQTNEYKLLQVGYTLDEVKILENNLNEEWLAKLINSEKNEDILNFLQEKYFIFDNLENYIKYKEENRNTNYNEIVTLVNVNRNHPYYEFDKDSNLDLDYTFIVNKYYKLPSDYEPGDLVTISQDYSWGELGSQKIRSKAYDAFKSMWNAAKEENITLMINSSYRAYKDQERVYNNYKSSLGLTAADKIAARPGYSEHQSGLALDIFCSTNSNQKTFAESDAYKWLLENSYKYGFILRYPEGKENITGYAFESWHYRYVGEDVAKEINDLGITFDEYYAYYIKK